MSGGGLLKGEVVLEMADGIGADMTIAKPFSLQTLIDAVEQVTRH